MTVLSPVAEEEYSIRGVKLQGTSLQRTFRMIPNQLSSKTNLLAINEKVQEQLSHVYAKINFTVKVESF